MHFSEFTQQTKRNVGIKKLGLIVNPIAGMGGKVGLKGTDGCDILEKSIKLGAKPLSQDRTIEALVKIKNYNLPLKIITCPGKMGEDAVASSGLSSYVIPGEKKNKTSAGDTQKAALEMRDRGVDLLLFAGGDGTARDIYKAVGNSIAVLGIPAGVKIHSAVFALNPETAGELAALYIQGKIRTFRDAEIMDIDENEYRKGILAARLYGYLKVPFKKRYVQRLKAGSSETERYSQEAIAHDIVENMSEKVLYVIGPGTTTKAIMEKMGLDCSLIGIDLVFEKKLFGKDFNESELLSAIKGKKAKLIITPIGGQGFLLGRGNQQLSPEVLKVIGKDNLFIVATKQKINSLYGSPLIVDTGIKKIDEWLSDYYRVVTGYREEIVYRVASGPFSP